MSLDRAIRDLFADAFLKHWSKFNVTKDDFVLAVKRMHLAYSIEGLRLGVSSIVLNYNNAAERCAYMHKYAPCHAGLLLAVFQNIRDYEELIEATIKDKTDPVSICCIGGGPGTDVVGMSALLSTMSCCEETSFLFTTIDLFEWSLAYESVTEVLEESTTAKFGSLAKFLSRQEVKSTFICDDVSDPRVETLETVGTADVLIMIKFVSAANPTKVLDMLQKLFTSMKSGALLLFVDNASGGFHEKLKQAASLCGLTAPVVHYSIYYKNPLFKSDLHGASSLSSTKVAVQMWKKP